MTRLAALGLGLFIVLLVVLADTRNLGPIAVVYSFPLGDKAGHLLLFGGLSFLASFAALRAGSIRTFTLVVAALLLVSGIEEGSQAFFPSRSPDLFDLIASFAGILAGARLALWATAVAGQQEQNLPQRSA
jgi:VanZ family protein